jgi:hypothetical protein
MFTRRKRYNVKLISALHFLFPDEPLYVAQRLSGKEVLEYIMESLQNSFLTKEMKQLPGKNKLNWLYTLRLGFCDTQSVWSSFVIFPR